MTTTPTPSADPLPPSQPTTQAWPSAGRLGLDPHHHRPPSAADLERLIWGGGWVTTKEFMAVVDRYATEGFEMDLWLDVNDLIHDLTKKRCTRSEIALEVLRHLTAMPTPGEVSAIRVVTPAGRIYRLWRGISGALAWTGGFLLFLLAMPMIAVASGMRLIHSAADPGASAPPKTTHLFAPARFRRVFERALECAAVCCERMASEFRSEVLGDRRRPEGHDRLR